MGYEIKLSIEKEPPVTKSVPEPRWIGLMGDSHGNLTATTEAVRILEERGAELLIHLGDIGDSVHYQNLQEILDLLAVHQVLSVKGNNDYLIALALVDHSGHHRPGCPGIFLNQLPMKRVIGDLCFAHSHPYDHYQAFYDPVNDGTTKKAETLFRTMPQRILFCGHSHSPTLFRMKADHVVREHPQPGKQIHLDKSERYIMIVGALDDGECALYDRSTGVYERIKIF